jgi:CRISPR-associated endonuclease/helicase Cas3
MQYYAHYNKTTKQKQFLKEHLFAVRNEIEQRFNFEVLFPGVSNDLLTEMACQMGLFHDIGKYTSYFQNYLMNGVHSSYKSHAHISACLLYNFFKKTIHDNNADIETVMVFFISYLCVRQHHINLTIANLFDNIDEKIRVLKRQKDDLQKKALPVISQELFPDEQTFESEFSLLSAIEPLLNDRKFQFISNYMSGRFKNEKWFFLLIYLFSLLTDADKHNSADLEVVERKTILPDKVDIFLASKHSKQSKTDLITKRKKAKETIIARMKELTADKALIRENTLFTITAPTGIGKTLASFQAALVLQKKIEAELNYKPLIITAIPFINIIEQTCKDYEGVVQDEARLVINHSLADIIDETVDENEMQSLDKVLLETEAWEGDIILTTFVQLFHSIFSSKNRALKKINKLAGSIVILDEIQSLPEKYMPLIGALLIKLNQFLGTRFILMTATQPKLLELGSLLLPNLKKAIGSQELLVDYQSYFKGLHRTRLISLLEQGELDTTCFLKTFFEIWSPEQSVLVVVNTIKRSIELFNMISEQVKRQNYKVPILYLSTNIISKHRAAVVRRAKRYLKWNIPIIMVSTQTIEAGVDLDFNMAFRDIAPIESLIQTAGRVNREGKKGDYLPVYIMQFENDSRIYKLHNLNHVKDILKENSEILENDYHHFVGQYYKKLIEMGVPDQSKRIWNDGVMNLDFEVIKEFQLIEKAGEVVDVIVECDQNITKLLDAYECILKGSFDEHEYQLIKGIVGQNKLPKSLSKFERKNIIRVIFSKISKYIIQIRVNRLLENHPIRLDDRMSNSGIHTDFLWIPPQEIDRYYDLKTGFIDKTNQGFLV